MHARPRARRDRDRSWTRDPASMRSNTAALGVFTIHVHPCARPRRAAPISDIASPVPSRAVAPVSRRSIDAPLSRRSIDATRRRPTTDPTSDDVRHPTTTYDDRRARRIETTRARRRKPRRRGRRIETTRARARRVGDAPRESIRSRIRLKRAGRALSGGAGRARVDRRRGAGRARREGRRGKRRGTTRARPGRAG